MALVITIILSLFTVGDTITVKPTYASGRGVYTQVMGAPPYTRKETFGNVFPTKPQVVISWASLYASSLVGYSVEVVESLIKTTEFSFEVKAVNGIGIDSFQVFWFAFLDDRIHVMQGKQGVSGSIDPIISFTITYNVPQLAIPSIVIFTNGISFSAASPYTNTNFAIGVGSPTYTGVVITISTTLGYVVSYYSYSFLYGDALYLSTGSISSCEPLTTKSGTKCCNLFSPNTNYLPSYTGVGLLSFSAVITGASIEFGLVNNAQTFGISSCNTDNGWATFRLYQGTTSYTAYQVSYFQYIMCPLYCTSCTSAANVCDACVSNSNRIGAQCTCIGQSYESNEIKCGQCLNICNGCSGKASNCNSCNPTTNRINPPNCNTCPQLYYVLQPGVDNCVPCNLNCNGCKSTISLCILCQTSKGTLGPPNCTNCLYQQFYELSSYSCQSTNINTLVCNGYCVGCVTISSNCIFCLPGSLRSNPPDCLTCPNNQFIQIGQDNCQQCDALCNQCTGSATNCVACNGLYRTNSPQCNQCSKLNYYIDSSNIDCQPCASFCNGCITSSINCISCWPFNFGQLTTICPSCPINLFQLNPPLCSSNIQQIICNSVYNRDSTCNCLPGFYNSDNQLSCLRCSSLCQTCTSSDTNCLSCISSLQQFIPPTCNSCKHGDFLLYGNCSQCSNICNTCVQSSTNCLTCVNPRINPPQCSCPDGYFNSCTQSCDFQCQSCSVSSPNCLICSGNRINPPLCSCPDGSIQQSVICSNCSTAAPPAQFSNDLNSITIVFQYPLKPIINCNAILNPASQILLGTNPQCSVNGNLVIITLGTNASISPLQPIFLKDDKLQFSNCKILISTIIPPIVQAPQYLLSPKLLFNNLEFTTTACDNVLINIIGSTYNGQRNLQLLGWTIIQAAHPEKLYSLIKKWNQNLLQQSYTITSEYLQNQQTIQLLVSYQNFVGQQSSSQFMISLKSSSIQLQLQVPKQSYIFDVVKVYVGASLQECEVNPIDQYINISVTISNETTILNYDYTLLSDSQQSIIFNSFQLTLLSNYQVSASAKWNYLITQGQEYFQVIQYPIRILIQGGDQQIGINQNLKLTANIFDPNVQTQVNMSSYTINWECLDLVTLYYCSNFQYYDFSANLNTTAYQSFKSLLILIQVQQGQSMIAKNNITVSIIEHQVSPIYLLGNQYQLNIPINLYDQVDLRIQYQNYIAFDVDKLTYYAFYIDQSYSKIITQLNNIETSINVQFFDIYSLNSNVKFQVTVNNPALLTTSVATQNIFINIPPSNCQLSIYPKGNKYSLQIDSCISNSQPLQYQLIYYASRNLYTQDSLNGIISNGIELTEFQISPFLTTYLTGYNTSIIVARIKDSLNGLSNTSISLRGIQLIDSTMFSLMLKDNTLNMRNNILLILMHIQISNETLSQSFSDKLQSIISKFNQSDKITKRIKQYSPSNWAPTNDQILAQLQIVNPFINQMSTELTQMQSDQFSGKYNKDYEIALLFLETELVASANYFSFLYGQSQQGLNQSCQNITYLITQGVGNITNLLGNLTKVNNNPKVINTTQFNISAQRFSTEKVNSYFGLQIVNQSNQTFIYKNQNFKINPYQNYSDFANPIKAPLIIPNLTDVNTVQIRPANPVPFNFPFIGEIEIQCASQIAGSWSVDICSVIQTNETIQCLCQTLSPLSILQALEYILEQFAQLFNHLIVGKINSFPYQSVLFTYIIAIFVGIFLPFKYILYRRDLAEITQVHPDQKFPKASSLENSEHNENNHLKQQVESLNSMRIITQIDLYTPNSLIGRVNSERITKKEGFIQFLQNSHIILELYYRFDSDEPRLLRLNILFLQQFGKICIFVLFGKNLSISIVIGLSLLQTIWQVVS